MKKWDADRYDNKLGFVSEYGKDMLTLLEPRPGEKVLDIGCGTGDLTAEIAKYGAIPLGIDVSNDMLMKAKAKYPHLMFQEANAIDFRPVERYNAIFSNAALHWMKQADQAAETMWRALQPGGRMVVEFGGKDNVKLIIQGIIETLDEYGLAAAERNPWYFPSIGEYSQLLEDKGFRVVYAVHFDRPSPLQDGYQGLNHWLNGFADAFFQGFSTIEKEELCELVKEKLKPVLFQEGRWVADYKRIRVKALKE